MDTTPRPSATGHLRMFSYLLMICGAVSAAVGFAVAFSAITQTVDAPASAPLGSVALAIAALTSGGLTFAVGIFGRAASLKPQRLETFRTLALVDLTATVLGLGLCYAVGEGLPTSLLFNGLLMAVCLVMSNNLRKTQN